MLRLHQTINCHNNLTLIQYRPAVAQTLKFPQPYHLHLSNIENNRVKISLQTLMLVCNALDVTIDFVLSKEYAPTTSVLDNEILKELNSCDVKLKEQILQIIKILQ